MKMKLEPLLHLGAAAVTYASALGLNPLAAALLMYVISIGLALCT
jgi:hypothetical protein